MGGAAAVRPAAERVGPTCQNAPMKPPGPPDGPAPVANAALADAPLPHPPRILRNVVVALLVAVTACGLIGNAISPGLVARHPLTLIGLNPSNRFLVLAGNRVDWLPYLLVAIPRRTLTVVLYFALGHWYGERAVRWLEHRSPDEGTMVRTIERLFSRAAWPIIVISPIGTVGLLAGAAGMAPLSVLCVMAVSIAGRVVALRLLGDIFSGPVDAFVNWIDAARGPLLVLSIGAVAYLAWGQRRRSKESLEELTHMGDDDS